MTFHRTRLKLYLGYLHNIKYPLQFHWLQFTMELFVAKMWIYLHYASLAYFFNLGFYPPIEEHGELYEIYSDSIKLLKEWRERV